MSNLSPWLLLTHGVIGVLGYATGMMVMYRAIPHEKRGTMPHRRLARLMRGSPSRGFVVILVMLAVIIALAIQSYAVQRQRAERDACVQQWGEEMVEVVEARSNAGAKYQKRATDRSDALDSLLLTAIAQSDARKGSDRERTPAEQRAIEAGSREYQKAVKRLRAVNAEVAEVREQNPYPVLDC